MTVGLLWTVDLVINSIQCYIIYEQPIYQIYSILTCLNTTLKCTNVCYISYYSTNPPLKWGHGIPDHPARSIVIEWCVNKIVAHNTMTRMYHGCRRQPLCLMIGNPKLNSFKVLQISLQVLPIQSIRDNESVWVWADKHLVTTLS